MKLLYVDGELVDLYPTTVIAQTLQVFDPGRIGSILTTYTNNLKVPRTKTNERIFRHLANPKVKSDVPYSSLSCEYFENGIPVIRNGKIVLNESNEKEYVFTIYSGAWGFFERIQGKTLWDLDFSDINGPWTDTVRDSVRNATTGIVQALIDDGRLEQELDGTIDNATNLAQFRGPQIYYHTVVEKIFQTFGFEYTGDIFANPIYKTLVMPLAVQYLDPSFLEAKTFYAGAPGTQEILDPSTPVEVMFTKNIRQGSDRFYDGISKYVVNNSDTADRYYRIRITCDIQIQVLGGTVDIALQATDYADTTQLNKGSGSYTLTFLASLGYKHGDEVRITIVKNTGTPVVTVLGGAFYGTVYNGVTSEEDETYEPTIQQGYVYFNKLFEPFDLTEFLQQFSVMFGVQITQINNVIHVNTLNKILDDVTGPDWTLKRDKGLDRIKYAFASYARLNVFKAPVDQTFSPDLTPDSFDGTFSIPNENLREQATIFTGAFYAGQMINTFGVFMYHLNVTEVISNLISYVRYPGNRLFFVRERYDFEPACIYEATPRTDYLVGFAWDPGQERNITWQFFLDTFYQKFVDRCLRRVRFLERNYILSDLDILAFNQQVPVFDSGERFLVVRIVNRVPRKACKVELLKVEANPEQTFDQTLGKTITGALEDAIEIIGDDLAPELEVQMELEENVAGNPTWQCTFNNGESVLVMVVGDESSDSDILEHEGKKNVATTVLKTNNDGNGTDGFPTATGYVEWLRNGVRVNTKTFDSSSHTSSQDLTYTYPDVKAWEILKVMVFEDGTIP